MGTTGLQFPATLKVWMHSGEGRAMGPWKPERVALGVCGGPDVGQGHPGGVDCTLPGSPRMAAGVGGRSGWIWGTLSR